MQDNERAAGQLLRNNKEEIGDGYVLLAIEVLAQAARDTRALCSPKSERRFQPGISTSKRRLKEEREALIEFVSGERFSFLADGVGMTYEKREERRRYLLDLLQEKPDAQTTV